MSQLPPRQPDLFEIPATPVRQARVFIVPTAPTVPTPPPVAMLKCPNRECGRQVEPGSDCACGRQSYQIYLANKWGST